MDAVKIETLPTNKPLLYTKLSETTDKSRDENDVVTVDENDEDDELRLRLSDEEDIEQGKTSGQVDYQQTNLEVKENGLEFHKDLAVTSEGSTNFNHIDLIKTQDLPKSEDTIVIEEEIETLSEENLDEELIDENCVNDQDSAMSGSERVPPLHNSPKYWNNFDKRWKGQNQTRNRQSFNRNANDWYHQQYPDKFNNKNNFNNHNNHFNRRSSSRLSYNNSPTRDWDKEEKKEEKDESYKTKKNTSISGDIVDKDQVIKENGISHVELKENKSSIPNEKLVSEKIDSDEKQIKSDEISESSSNQKCIQNGINSDGDSSSDKRESIEDSVTKVGDSDEKNDSTASAIKNCDLLMTDVDNEKCESKVDEEDENSSSNKENLITNCTENSSNDAESKQSSDTEEVELNISDVASQSDAPKDICENSMDISDENLIPDESVENRDEDDGTVKDDDDGKLKDDDDDDDDDVNDVEKEEEKESNPMNEDSNHSSQEKSVCDMEVDSSDDKKSSDKMEVESESVEKSMIENADGKDSETPEENSIDQPTVVENTNEDKEKAKQADKSNSNIEEVDLVDDDAELIKLKKNEVSNATTVEKDVLHNFPIDAVDNGKAKESNEDGRAVVHKRRRRKRIDLSVQDPSFQNDLENGVRQKRRSARNAEEMIRKEILKNDEEDNSSDDPEKLVQVNYKKLSLPSRALSPPSLKRTLDDVDQINETATLKKVKPNSATDNATITKEPIKELAKEQIKELIEEPLKIEKKELIKDLKEEKMKVEKKEMSIFETGQLVRKISQEDIRGKLKKLSQEEMEAILLQKIVECITMRGEMGKLREQARTSKRNQEACRAKCQQLQKQVEGFEMVLKRITYDKNANDDKYAPPIKINRSVGLQVNFMSENGIQNLKQIQALKAQANVGRNVPTTLNNVSQDNISPRKTLKTRSPRRPEVPTSTNIQMNPISSSASVQVNPTAANKPIDPTPKRTTVTLPNAQNIVQIVPPPTGQSGQTVVVNSSNGNNGRTLTIQRTSTGGNVAPGNRTSDLIDLTDEEDKSKSSAVTPITTQTISTRFPRVLQAVPASVALPGSQNLRILQTGAQGSQTAIVNNVNSPRVAYVMRSDVNGVQRQIVLTSSNTIRPVTTVGSRNISTISYKNGISTLANGGTVRVIASQGNNPNSQLVRHPAPLPETPQPESNVLWKLPPPAPSLKISKVATGIVLSWNMEISNKYAEIVSYQLYAYQEVAGTSPSAALWKKVGDVRALPLPMACTLTQFLEGNNYYFAVRAVDIHSRFGQYSRPGNISL